MKRRMGSKKRLRFTYEWKNIFEKLIRSKEIRGIIKKKQFGLNKGPRFDVQQSIEKVNLALIINSDLLPSPLPHSTPIRLSPILQMKQPTLKNHLKMRESAQSLTPQEIQNPLMPESEQAPSQHSRSVHRKECFFKLACIVFLVSGFVLYRFGNFVNINTSCIVDAYQEYTFSLNRKLYDGWDNPVLGVGQVIMDFWICFSALFWMFVIKNMRFPIAVLTFYMVRSGLMLFTKFPFPPNMVWHDPGFMSFTVPYDHTRDFFFSGHTGSLVLIMLEFYQLTVLHSKKPAGYVWILIFICLVYIMNMLIVTRVHYTIDVAGGLIFSVYCYWLISQITVTIDKVISAPYKYVIEPLIKKVKQGRNRRKLVLDESQGTVRDSLADKLVNESEAKLEK